MNRTVVIAGAAAVVAFGAGYAFLTSGERGAPAGLEGALSLEEALGGGVQVAQAAEASEAATDAAVVVPLEERGYALGDVPMGDPDAPVTIVEYSSLICPHCARFHQDTFPAVKENFIDTGMARIIVREVYTHGLGVAAAQVARCGGPDRYHAYLKALFENQENYLTQDGQANLDELRRIGRLGGLSNEQIDACLRDGEFFNALTTASQEQLAVDQITGTPNFFVNGEPVRGNTGYDALAAIIEAELEAAQ